MPAPATSSRHLYTGHRRGHIQAAPRLRAHRSGPLSQRPPTDPSFDAIVVSFRCVSSGSHMFVFSSHTRPAHSETSTAALTTPALDRRSLRWFGVSACTATPEDLPPSLAQHGSCRRSSTSSSSLPFRTHVGAGNSAVVVDLPRCEPMLSPRVPNLVPIPGPRMERETPGQRPRLNYGHPQARLTLPEPSATAGMKRRPRPRHGGRSSLSALARAGPVAPSSPTGQHAAAGYDRRHGRIRSSPRPAGTTAVVVVDRTD